ncbi:MAG: hypothetical protein ACLPX9_16575 [Rhodomicrobium sp.]
MTHTSCKIAAAILFTLPVCYTSGAAQAQRPLGSISNNAAYVPETSIPMNQFKKTTTTVFWVGEDANAENGYIDNYGSYWDEHWMKNFGGVDSPGDRDGYFPAGFQPKQNPFYVALPFAEVDRDGNLKEAAKGIPGFGENREPLTRNRWVEVRYRGKSCYAQWQDVGPSEENDFDWVFGAAKKPKNQYGLKAGLDISPAAAQYLGIEDSARTEWRFVDAAQVPEGPWKAIVTR